MSTQFDTTISPARRQRLIWTLLGSCALAALQPGAALAQDGGAIVLDTVTVEADGAGSLLGGGYYSGIVVDQSTGASRMPTSLLDTPASVSVITAEERRSTIRRASRPASTDRMIASTSSAFAASMPMRFGTACRSACPSGRRGKRSTPSIRSKC